MKVIEIPCEFTDDAPRRLDRVVQQATGQSRAGVRGLLDHHCVTVNGEPSTTPQAMVSRGDVVRVTYDPHRRYKEKPAVAADPAYRILHEDAHLIVVNKSAHVLTVPTASGKGKTLIDALDHYLNRGKPPAAQRKLHVVHRLDQGVSGVLVVAKSADVARKLKQQFADHKPQRIYIAIVNGSMKLTRGTFRSNLATDYSLNRYSTKRPDHGELAVTHWEVIEPHGPRPRTGTPGRKSLSQHSARQADYTLVQVQLETGRRNQIRVHFAEAGHPVLGDPRYPRQLREAREDEIASSTHIRWRAKRLALHAKSLSFTHPVTGDLMQFEAELPREFEQFLRSGSKRKAPRNSRTR